MFAMSRDLDRVVRGAKEGEEHLKVTNHLHFNTSVVPDKMSQLLTGANICPKKLVDSDFEDQYCS